MNTNGFSPADLGRLAGKRENEERPIDTLTIGNKYEIKDSPFRQVPQNFKGHYVGVIEDCATFIAENDRVIRFSDWDLNEAMEYGEITIIEIS